MNVCSIRKKILKQKVFGNKMLYENVKKQYLTIGLLIFILLFLFNTKFVFVCEFNGKVSSYLPVIYGITPTYARLAQKADLIRLSQTLMHVENFHWIVVEDSTVRTKLVTNLLKESNLTYTHLNIKTHKTKYFAASGVEQRNQGLDWLKGHLQKAGNKGFVYFMDDDNTYSLKLFDEIRKVKRVGVWPVGMVGGMRVEMPLVKDGKVIGFNSLWKPLRPFPIDMAGFAIKAALFLEHPEAQFTRKVLTGFQESVILEYFTTREALEPLADNCTKVYVWHTRTQKPPLLNQKTVKRRIIPDGHIEV